MKSRTLFSLQFLAFFFTLTSSAFANTWYVDGVNGSDSNNCQTATSACKTITHAISLAVSGDSIMLAPANYAGGLDITFSLNLIGADYPTTNINGVNNSSVITVEPGSVVTISGVTIIGGQSSRDGGGISNSGNLTVNESAIRMNSSAVGGGGISTHGEGSSLLVTRTRITSNRAPEGGGIQCVPPSHAVQIDNSLIAYNVATGNGGGIGNGLGVSCGFVIVNSTIALNISGQNGGGIFGFANVNNGTIANNTAANGGGVYSIGALFQNSIVAKNRPQNCNNLVFSFGYNLSSDDTCEFDAKGDIVNTDPMLGPLQPNGGFQPTMALPANSPAIDAGNPTGCTSSLNTGTPPPPTVLKNDQRGAKRPGDPKLTTGCDMGAYEYQFPK